MGDQRSLLPQQQADQVITSREMILFGSYSVRADCCTQIMALEWLEGHPWAYMRFDFDVEDPIRWRVRWTAWPFVRAAGAGYTMSEAISRCFQCAVERMKRAPRATEEDLASI